MISNEMTAKEVIFCMSSKLFFDAPQLFEGGGGLVPLMLVKCGKLLTGIPKHFPKQFPKIQNIVTLLLKVAFINSLKLLCNRLLEALFFVIRSNYCHLSRKIA